MEHDKKKPSTDQTAGLSSNIASTSTATPRGKLFTLTAARVCSPFFSNILARMSDAPFITLG